MVSLETPRPLLGTFALETLGFKVDPVTGRPEEVSPEGGYLLEAFRPAPPRSATSPALLDGPP
ncbi:MAG: hypothetical protein KatS3mg131_1965 [Candidatus Tectimicrobiota bacterium]|nr:MAG: hypothetical protein KatS3mg131_1965 [Candidatus Tectomicrobia bacterium]